jgi:Tol biopolymer transport system component
MRACTIRADGTGLQETAPQLITSPNHWTQFAGWSPDGRTAIVLQGWQSEENAAWEERNQQFRFAPEHWLLDAYLVDLHTGFPRNLTAVERISHYNGSMFYLPNAAGLGFTPLIKGESRPHIMQFDGRGKRDVSGRGSGYAYGFSVSPDGSLISFHENYQIYIAAPDGTSKTHINTGSSFNFGPLWSPDSGRLLFLSGTHGSSHPCIVRRNGTELTRMLNRGAYNGSTQFLDVPDFHQGSSDTPAWAPEGDAFYITAEAAGSIELFRVPLEGTPRQITKTPPGSRHYHPAPAPEGRIIAYGCMRGGVRNIAVLNLQSGTEILLTNNRTGSAAMWPHWQPLPSA